MRLIIMKNTKSIGPSEWNPIHGNMFDVEISIENIGILDNLISFDTSESIHGHFILQFQENIDDNLNLLIYPKLVNLLENSTEIEQIICKTYRRDGKVIYTYMCQNVRLKDISFSKQNYSESKALTIDAIFYSDYITITYNNNGTPITRTMYEEI